MFSGGWPFLKLPGQWLMDLQYASPCSFFITTSKDMTARLYSLDPVEGFRPKTFSGHRDAVIAGYFSSDHKTVSWLGRAYNGPVS